MEKSYLDQLIDLIQENAKNRKEEGMGFSEKTNAMLPNVPMTSNQRFPLTKKLIADNPNLPQEDIQAYKQNVQADQEENMTDSMFGMGGPINVVGKATKPLIPAITKAISSRFPAIERMLASAENKAFVKEIQDKIALREKFGPRTETAAERISRYEQLPVETSEQTAKRLKRADIDAARAQAEREAKEAKDLAESNPMSQEVTQPLINIKKKK